MKLIIKNIGRLPLLFTISALLLLTGCKNLLNDDDHDQHQHAEGAVLMMNGAEIVRIEDGAVQSGQIEVTEGEETPLITIYFLNEDGDTFQPEESEYSLRWEGIDQTIADVEQHDQDGAWRFHIHGAAQGNTSVRFLLWHNDENHADYETPLITISVTQ